MSEIIQLTDTARLVVEYDQDAENPRADWDMLTGFVKIEGRGDSRLSDVPAVHDDPIAIRDAHERIHRSVACSPTCPWGGRHRVHVDEEDVIRWARIFHDMHLEYDSEHGGYWFVDPDGFREGGWTDGDPLQQQADVIKAERESYRQWADGEVYGVVLERLETWAKLGPGGTVGDGTQRDEWEQVDALWGCYLDDEYTAQAVADQNFNLTPEEFVALGLPGSLLSTLAEHTVEDIRLSEEDVPLIDPEAGRLTPAGELYLREYRAAERGERYGKPEAVSGEW